MHYIERVCKFYLGILQGLYYIARVCKLFIHALFGKGLEIIYLYIILKGSANYLLRYITRVVLHCKGLQIIYSCIIWQGL